MNPLEEVAPADMGRTYREKKFWEKSFVVLAGVGMNFLLAFLMFYGIVVINGVPEPIPVVSVVVEDSPAAEAGLQEGDVIVAVNGSPVADWTDATDALVAARPGPAEIVVERDGQTVVVDAVLTQNENVPGAGFLGVAPEVPQREVGPIEGIGLAGQLVLGGDYGYLQGSVQHDSTVFDGPVFWGVSW